MRILFAVAVSFVCLAVAAAQDNDAAVKKDKGQLKGTWKIEVFENADGKQDDIVGATLSFDGDNLEFKHKDETKKATYSLNPLGKPKEITIKIENQEMPGIYKLDKDSLTICICMEPNQARPNEFAPKNPYQVATLKRVKE